MRKAALECPPHYTTQQPEFPDSQNQQLRVDESKHSTRSKHRALLSITVYAACHWSEGAALPVVPWREGGSLALERERDAHTSGSIFCPSSFYFIFLYVLIDAACFQPVWFRCGAVWCSEVCACVCVCASMCVKRAKEFPFLASSRVCNSLRSSGEADKCLPTLRPT